ncbi:carboxypeptidase-like regulatory domain-containing protein [Hufsiella ginkgonis]|uniref:Carboxypeptidase-like regulatory domain-containing protein n=1 Tax=Hufsiella ginkgonis TaxID=2695274 RepID=A0A7K1Y2N7_9SPHI|nr:carboxypeptidase-like regulatory domain-containing protein [Hufsiella ginkgonis]MXV17279.1 hypothetical protein [Hufsiella ginkgonis]
MRHLFLFMCMILPFYAAAQLIRGTVTDQESHLPVQGANIVSASGTTITDAAGRFTARARFPDTLRISYIGYKKMVMPLASDPGTELRIRITRGTITLDEIFVAGTRNYRKDSLSYRTQFKKEFSYQPPKLTDAVGPARSGGRGASLITINPVALYSYLTRKSARDARLKRRLLDDEANRFIDHWFTTGKVEQVTALSGDSLTLFMNRYRPTSEMVRKLNEYEMIDYIKRSAVTFRSGK